jgi:hypothetical protein
MEFDRLAERFASIPGVESCRHEDRELFRVKTRVLATEDLKKLLWAQFLKAAGQKKQPFTG